MATRELKFRAWDGNKMINDIVPINKNTVITNIQGFPDSMMAVGCIVTSIMQYTGLKDKNGKEIYEGDIVTWKHLKDNCKYIIYYNEDEVHYYAKPIVHCEGSSMESYLDNIKMEVIGNIHQNPELLSNVN